MFISRYIIYSRFYGISILIDNELNYYHQGRFARSHRTVQPCNLLGAFLLI